MTRFTLAGCAAGVGRGADRPRPAPFLTSAGLAEKVATSAITLVVGLAIGSLLAGVSRSAIRTGR